MKQIVNLSLKARKTREEVVAENEEHIQKKLAEDGFESASDEDGEGMEDDEDDEQAEKDMMEINKLRKQGKKNQDDDDVEDESDSDYEYTGGDAAIYDSALDDVDELIFIRDTLTRIS